ncbi:beta-glucosidase family protein [Pseudomonas sp. Ant30-3]|uniref:beta-glucosidase family protein n=1 Tax=Pseudomonas sp. Ant30-3 TaxID=1488328 RepID=UPI000A7FEFB1|nr:glycoside hydrolase family 3 N-terminal domain-containing protein [Pseudomonas sp. Ant30-3]
MQFFPQWRNLAPTIPLLTAAIALAGCASGVPADDTTATPWMDTALAPERRSDLLLAAMSFEQKAQQLTGALPEIVPELPHCKGARHTTGIPALRIPTLRVTNGPVGIGQNDCVGLDTPPNMGYVNGLYADSAAYFHASSAKATAVPSAIAVAASFDPDVATAFGELIGEEGSRLALHVFEAPGMNLARLPLAGRNFEYKGEDPYLAGVISVAETRAVQGKGLIAVAKHYVGNEQEVNRMSVSERIDPQVLHELYLLPFEMAVKDGETGAVMCSYNALNGAFACENEEMLTEVLRKQWGFQGYVQSDFFAAKSTAKAMRAGLDHEMPLPQFYSEENLRKALDAGELAMGDIDTALRRRYVQMFKFGIFDKPIVQQALDVEGGGRLAREIGVQTAVLLQNNGALPLPRDARRVLLVGKSSQIYAQQAVAGGSMVDKVMGDGGGSSDVVPFYTVAPAKGLRNVFADVGNKAVTVQLALVDDANAAATIDGAPVDFDQVLEAAASAAAVVVMAGTVAEEGADRATFSDERGTKLVTRGDSLDWYAPAPKAISVVGGDNPGGNSQTIAMIDRLLAVESTTARATHAKTALVLKDNAGVPIPARWLGDRGPAMLETWFPGQEDGHIVADLLLGVHNPEGKLPVTFPIKGQGFMETVSASQYPGIMDTQGIPQVEYSEQLQIGYRWYDATNTRPAFAFGHGLSYTRFELAEPRLQLPASEGDVYRVETTVRNTGARAGAEVVQVYLSVPSGAGLPQPPKRLVGFHKVPLAVGGRERVTIDIDPAASNHPLSVWDVSRKAFVIPSGTYTVWIGSASDRLVRAGTFVR